MNGNLGELRNPALSKSQVFSAGIVYKTVAEKYAHNVFSRTNMVGQVIFVIVNHIVGLEM